MLAALLLLLVLVLLTKSVLKQREVPATVSSFYVSVVYTAMLWTSIAVVLGCFYFCPLDCDASVMVVDCAAVETGCMLEKYIPAKGCNKIRAHFYFLLEVLLLLLRAAAAAHNISTEAERGTGYYYCCFLCVYSISVAAVEKGYAFLLFGRGAAAANNFSCWQRCCFSWCLCCLQHQY